MNNIVINDFPLRPTFTASVIVPKNLTVAEATRLCAFVHTLVMPEQSIPRRMHMNDVFPPEYLATCIHPQTLPTNTP